MSRRYPSNAEPIQFLRSDPQFLDAGPQGVKAGGASEADAVLADLEVANLARAVVDGGLRARWELGAAIGRALCGGKGQ